MHGKRTADQYQRDLKEFGADCGKCTLEELTRTDVQNFIACLVKKKRAPKTISNRLTTLRAFLRKNGLDGLIVNTSDAPRVHKKIHICISGSTWRSFSLPLLKTTSSSGRSFLRQASGAGALPSWLGRELRAGLLHLHAKPDLSFSLKDAG